MKHLALVLVLLAGRSAVADGGNDESDPFLGQLNSVEFLPLEVGNSWSYTHVYRNETYFEDAPGVFPDIDPADLKPFEVPGYPFGEGKPLPPESLLLPDGRELVIEITHTETIEGFEYFVFSEPDYEWPPLPDGFLSGQKVRVTEDRILVFWRRGQDQPLYEFGMGWFETGPGSPRKEIWWEGDPANRDRNGRLQLCKSAGKLGNFVHLRVRSRTRDLLPAPSRNRAQHV